MTLSSFVFVLCFASAFQEESATYEFSQAELKCFEKGSVLYEPAGKCYKLLETGPCRGERQWLVLDKEQVLRGLRAVCRECPCCDKPFRAVFWPADGQCYRIPGASKKLCPSAGTVLETDPFGEGECDCVKEPLHARWGEDPPCYPLYHQGPCGSGHIFIPSGNSTSCERDPCLRQNRENKTLTFVAWQDGKCYALGSRGPCNINGTAAFNIHPVTQRPTCINRVNQIVDLPTTCDTDQNGDCRKEVALPTQTQYLNDLIMSAQKRRAKRRTSSLNTKGRRYIFL